MLENCRQIAGDQVPIDIFSEEEKGHGRVEFRKVEVYNTLNKGVSLDKEWSQYANTLITVTRHRSKFDTRTKQYDTSVETSFYLASIKTTSKVFFHAIRKHWGIENRNHYVRDVTMKEDQSRIRKNPENFAKIRSTALNIMRKKGDSNIENSIFANSLNISKMIRKYHDFL